MSTVRLEPGGAEVRVDLSFVPPRPGLRFVEVRVPTLPGEATGANNRRLVAIDVREEKTGVVVLSGRLTWDHTFLRRALEADSTLALSAGYWSKGSLRTVPGTKTPPSLNGASLHGVRVIVLDHVSPAQLGAEGAQGVLAFVRAGGGLLVVTGSDDDALAAWRGSPLEALLPAQIAGGGGQDTQARLTLAGRRHALFIPRCLARRRWTRGRICLRWECPPVSVRRRAAPRRSSLARRARKGSPSFPGCAWARGACWPSPREACGSGTSRARASDRAATCCRRGGVVPHTENPSAKRVRTSTGRT
jgi:hypothetical protein